VDFASWLVGAADNLLRIANLMPQLADDVKLDLVSRWKRAGRREVSGYFTNYDSKSDWHLVPGWLDGREVIAIPASRAPSTSWS
jgi:hypothetical protein